MNASVGMMRVDVADATPILDISDFFISRMDVMNVSIRDLGSRTAIKHSRLGDILHRTPAKRRPMRLDESSAICSALQTNHFVAMLACELYLTGKVSDLASADRVASLMSTMTTGMASRLTEVLGHIDGLRESDIREEHGLQAQDHVIDYFEKHYSEVATRRMARLARSGNIWEMKDALYRDRGMPHD